MKKVQQQVGHLWSITEFSDPAISRYAEELIIVDARRGLTTLGIVSLMLLAGASVLYAILGFAPMYVYTFAVLAMLSLHIIASARVINDTRVLNLLGMTLLVLSGMSLVLLAHYAGAITTALFAGIVLLFMVVPLVPWGLREAVITVGLVYILFTASTASVTGRFNVQTLWLLQFLMLAAGIVTLTVIARNVGTRKHDIESRYQLNVAHQAMEKLSHTDPLTGAWNRRFLEKSFSKIVEDYQASGQAINFTLIDLDNFKLVNDGCGHNYGDLVLCRLVDTIQARLRDGEYLIRIGGDEFAMLSAGDSPTDMLETSAREFENDPLLNKCESDVKLSISAGIASIQTDQEISLEEFYRKADMALYQAKAQGKSKPGQSFFVCIACHAKGGAELAVT